MVEMITSIMTCLMTHVLTLVFKNLDAKYKQSSTEVGKTLLIHMYIYVHNIITFVIVLELVKNNKCH